MLRNISVSNNPVYLLFHTPGNPGPLILRLTVAGIFFFYGMQKSLGWFGGLGWDATMSTWTETFGLPTALVGTVIIAELLVAAALFFGFLTRLAALGVIAIMLGSIVVLARGSGGLTDWELPILLCATGLALFFQGAGAISLDRAISRNLLPVFG